MRRPFLSSLFLFPEGSQEEPMAASRTHLWYSKPETRAWCQNLAPCLRPPLLRPERLCRTVRVKSLADDRIPNQVADLRTAHQLGYRDHPAKSCLSALCRSSASPVEELAMGKGWAHCCPFLLVDFRAHKASVAVVEDGCTSSLLHLACLLDRSAANDPKVAVVLSSQEYRTPDRHHQIHRLRSTNSRSPSPRKSASVALERLPSKGATN